MPKTVQKRKSPKKTSRKSATPNKSSNFRSKSVRSRAFAKAILLARPYTLSPERLDALLKEASRTVARLPRQPFQESWAYLHAMLRLLRAFQLGDYRAVPPKALLSIV